MKRGFFILLICIGCLPVAARHVAGGELFYEYIGPGAQANTSVYRITLRLFRDCASSGPSLQIEQPTVGFYENNGLVSTLPLPISGAVTTLSLNTAVFPCLVGAVKVCYEMAVYSAVTVLTDNLPGYTLSRLGCCRVDTISNLSQPRNVGANYVTKIPGRLTLATGHNNSPQFNVRDTALVCANKSFKLDFGATDTDGDSLTYSFCEAYTAGGGGNNSPPTPSLSAVPLPYTSPYSGSLPLGSRVTINASTGIISGIAPRQGQYVVNVCVTEWRKGKAFTEHRKDFILKIQDCDFVEAVLPEKIVQCDDFTVRFENESTSSAITSYSWNFGDPSGTTNTSSDPTPSYTYRDTGRYIATLNVTGPGGCVGEASTVVFVYPGFKPAFSATGSCYQSPYFFTDATVARYGRVDSWRWDFGDDTTFRDTSRIQNPAYRYGFASPKNVSLIVSSDKGCMDTLQKEVLVGDKPTLLLPFRDTLICSIDTLAIPVGNTGTISWLPNRNIIGGNTSRPLVFPKSTTRYMVTVNDNGCINTDTVTVNVLDFIKVSAGNDSLICRTDSIRLQTVSQALGYRWTSSTGELVASVKNPLVKPLVNTYYYVLANLGKCQDRDTIFIRPVNYPRAAAGADTTICFGDRAQLRGSITGSSLSWSPAATLLNPNTATPVAAPARTTVYVLRASDTLGCPKTVSDTVIVTVSPKVIANAGSDTSIVINQPLQLIASGGQRYIWSPETGLSDASVYNPVATIDERGDSVIYRVRVFDGGNCYSDDEIVVRIYRNGPDILVPSAFTPNGDGKNDILKPLVIGIPSLRYFRVYNRWGQLLHTSTVPGRGWDGSLNGLRQPAGGYVYQAEGVDFTGKLIFRKGTVVLIR